MNNKELKVKSFRVDEDTFSKFKEIAASEFGNQGQCLDALINLYETEQSKSTLVTRQLEIESFQDYVNKINRLFVTSLQLSEDAENRAKESFIKKLESKDEALLTLKEKLETKQKEEQILKEKVKNLLEEQKRYKEELENLEESKSTLTQLANRNFDLSEELKNKVEKLEKKLADQEKIDESLLKIKEELLEEKSKITQLNKMLEEEKENSNKLKKEFLINKRRIGELLEEKKSYQLLIEKLRNDHKTELDILEGKYSERYKIELEERINLLKREHNLEIKELEFKIKTLENKS